MSCDAEFVLIKQRIYKLYKVYLMYYKCEAKNNLINNPRGNLVI